MENNLKKCRNYNIIVNCEFLDDDLFSKKLVEFYKIEVSKANNQSDIDKLIKYDNVLIKYINDYNFSKRLRNSIDVTSLLRSNMDLSDAVLEYAVDFSLKYDEKIEEPIINTRWI